MTILKKYLRIFLKKTYWIPIGSNILPADDQRKEDYLGIPLFSYFGMVYPGKGLDLIMDVLETLKVRGRPFTFKFLGGVSVDAEGYESAFRNKIRERRLEDVAEHIGLLPAVEISAWLNKSRFIFLPYEGGVSDRRGSFMAAIAHGKAALTSPPAVTIPFLINGINVLWPEDPSVDAYTVLIERLFTDDAFLDTIERGATELAANFTWDKIAAEHELLLLKG
jgi:glycosyltransferase involved in cell wall biosynthesis